MAPIAGKLDFAHWVAAIIALGCVGFLGAFPAFTPSLIKMFRDFGGTLPVPTQVLLQYWVTLVPAAVVLLMVMGGLSSSLPLATRRYLILSSLIIGIVGSLATLWAMYLPLWELADNIK